MTQKRFIVDELRVVKMRPHIWKMRIKWLNTYCNNLFSLSCLSISETLQYLRLSPLYSPASVWPLVRRTIADHQHQGSICPVAYGGYKKKRNRVTLLHPIIIVQLYCILYILIRDIIHVYSGFEFCCWNSKYERITKASNYI